MLTRNLWHKSITAERVCDAVDRRMTTLDNPGFFGADELIVEL